MVHERLKEGREQRQRRQQDDADDEDEEDARREIAILEQFWIDKRRLGCERVDDENPRRESGDRRFQDDFARAEPVLLLAAIEEELEGADGDREGREP